MFNVELTYLTTNPRKTTLVAGMYMPIALLISKEISRLFKQTYSTWDNKPTISVEKNDPTNVRVIVESDHYFWQNFGTKPHILNPDGQVLKIPTQYKPKLNRPNVFKPSRGSISSTSVFTKKEVTSFIPAVRFDLDVQKNTKEYIISERDQIQEMLKDHVNAQLGLSHGTKRESFTI